MKIILVLLLMGMALFVGCERNDNGGKREMDNSCSWQEFPISEPPEDIWPEPDFDFERTVRLIQEAVGSDDEIVNRLINASVFPYFLQAGVKGAINAEVVQTSGLSAPMPDMIFVKIEAEDNRFYYLRLSQGQSIDRIWDYETKHQIWPSPQRNRTEGGVTPEANFDFERTVKIMQEAVGSNDELVNQAIDSSARSPFRRSGVNGAIIADVVENSDFPTVLLSGDIVIKIGTEDGENYILHFAAKGRRLENIWNYETREQIWPPLLDE